MSAGRGGGGGKRFDDEGRMLYFSDLPETFAWQELKDLCKTYGRVIRADVNRCARAAISYPRVPTWPRPASTPSTRALRCVDHATGPATHTTPSIMAQNGSARERHARGRDIQKDATSMMRTHGALPWATPLRVPVSPTARFVQRAADRHSCFRD